MAAMKPTRPVPPDFDAGPEQDLEGLGGPAVSGPPVRDVEGLGPDGDVDHLGSPRRTVKRRSRKLTDEASSTEAYDCGLGQDPGVDPLEAAQEAGEVTDGADIRSR